MKVTGVTIRLAASDILDIIKEYVKVEGLNIKDIKIDELITVYGSYKKGLDIPFQGTFGFGNIYENMVNIKIFDFKVAKVGIIRSVKNFALKAILKDLGENGIFVEDDNLVININNLSKLIPFVYFKVIGIKLTKDFIEIEVEDIIYAPNKEAGSLARKKEARAEIENKITDKYTKVRENIENKVPDKYKNIVEYAMIIPDIAALLWRLFRDKRVEMKTKLLVGGVIAYLASPIDILPDFIPLVGKIDDVAIVFFAMNKIINDIPKEVLLANWTGKEDIVKIVQDGVSFISKIVGSQNVGKLLDYIKRLSTKTEKEEISNEERNNIY